jgi:hypothetical protein
MTPAEVNANFAKWQQLGLVSAASTQPNSAAFVVSVRGGQWYRIEPVPIHFLDLVEQSTIASDKVAIQQGYETAAEARSQQQAVARMVASLRRTGTLPPGMSLGVGPARVFQQPLREAVQIDRYDPAAVAAQLPAYTTVLLTCSNADIEVPSALEDHLAAGRSRRWDWGYTRLVHGRSAAVRARCQT